MGDALKNDFTAYCDSEFGLVERLKFGDQDAFKTLYRQYFDKVFSFASKMSTTNEDAEEIVRSVFLQVWDSRMELQLGQQFDGFLFKLSQNVVIDRLRHRECTSKR